MSQTHAVKRISVLDGFRALAIIPVIFFHFFSRWTPPNYPINFYPYVDAYRDFPLFQYGYLGVEFFFVISGFVISMTQASSINARDFAVKRISRLWPAMLLCSVLTFLTLNGIPQDFFTPHLADFIPSLTFIDPYLMGRITHRELSWIDGSYWSLWVEVRFYFWAAFIFFTTRSIFKDKYLEIFFAFSTAVFALFVVSALKLHALSGPLEYLFFPRFMPLFTMGVAFNYLYQGKKIQLAHFVIFESLAVLALQVLFLVHLENTTPVSRWIETGVYALVVAAFYIFIYRSQWLAVFGWKPMSKIGAASYSLYLLHQNIGVTWIHYLNQATGLSGELAAILVILALIVASILIYRFWETPGKNILLKLLLPAKSKA